MLDLYQDTTKAIRLILTSIFFFQDLAVGTTMNFSITYGKAASGVMF